MVFGYYGNHQLVHFGEKDVEGERGGEAEGGRSQTMDAASSMYSYVTLLRESGSSQDLNVSIIHEVVLRYANMNYLTSQADLLLRPPPPISVHPLSSVFLHIGSKSESPLRTASFSWSRLR